MKHWLIVIIAAFVLFIFFSILTYLILNDGSKKHQENKKSQTSGRKFDTSLEKMIATATDANLSEQELKELALLFVKTHKLGSKTSKDLSEDAKKKLEFVSAFASNNKSTPNLVSFLNRELKKISASYKKEIDAYEQMGLAKRKIKEK